MGESQSEIMQQIAVPRYAPRLEPTAIPAAAWNDAPLVCLAVNGEWISHILGVMEALDQYDTWIGTADEIFAARQQVNEIMLAMMTACEPPPPTTFSFWTDDIAPEDVATVDNSAVILGLKFQVTTAGNITGVRYYKNYYNIGEHYGSLFTSDGTLLASVMFTHLDDDRAIGWQTASFDTPIAIDADTTYIVAYWSGAGNYSYTHDFFSDGLSVPPLYALSNTEASGQGVYVYSETPTDFPTEAASNTNYWADVVFEPTP